MTRPFIGSDKTYEEQRKCRMQDAIDDYLNDEKVSPKQIYREMMDCMDDVLIYHQKQTDRVSTLKSLFGDNLK